MRRKGGGVRLVFRIIACFRILRTGCVRASNKNVLTMIYVLCDRFEVLGVLGQSLGFLPNTPRYPAASYFDSLPAPSKPLPEFQSRSQLHPSNCSLHSPLDPLSPIRKRLLRALPCHPRVCPRDRVLGSHAGEVCLLELREVRGEVVGSRWKKVVQGDDEEGGREEDSGREGARACEDGPGEGCDADVEETWGERFGGGYDGLYATCVYVGWGETDREDRTANTRTHERRLEEEGTDSRSTASSMPTHCPTMPCTRP